MRTLSDLKVCYLAGTLGQGGAERQLFYALRALRQSGAVALEHADQSCKSFTVAERELRLGNGKLQKTIIGAAGRALQRRDGSGIFLFR